MDHFKNMVGDEEVGSSFKAAAASAEEKDPGSKEVSDARDKALAATSDPPPPPPPRGYRKK